jgi:hypothetical protein
VWKKDAILPDDISARAGKQSLFGIRQQASTCHQIDDKVGSRAMPDMPDMSLDI